MTTPDHPQRVTLSEVVRSQLQALQRTHGDHSSVELTRNAKGDTQIRVSVSTRPDGIDTPEDAAARAVAIYDGLAERYPIATEATGGAASRG